MKSASFVLMGLSVSSGVGAIVLLAANMIVWAILTLWVGSALAFVGFGLILWALRPKSSDQDAEVTIEPDHSAVNAELA